MKGISNMRLSSLSLALLAITALSACNDDSSTTPTTSPDVEKVADMRAVFSNYQTAIGALDSSSFGIINDEIASAREELDKTYLEKLQMIDRSTLSDEDKIYYDTFIFDRNIAISGAAFHNVRFGNFAIPITHFYNYIEWNAEWVGAAQSDLAAYQDHMKIIVEFTAWVKNLHEQYALGEEENSSLPKVLLQRLLESIDSTISKDSYALLKGGLKDIQAKSGDYDPAFTSEYERTVDDAVAEIESLITYIEGDLMASARGTGATGSITDEHIGWGDLPNGKAWYQWQLDRNSTTGKSAEELHKLGEALVADAKSEMERVARLVVSKHGKTITADWRDADKNITKGRVFIIEKADETIDLAEFFAYLNSEQFFYERDGRTTEDTDYAKTCLVASSPSACEAALVDYNKFKNDANTVVSEYFKTIKADYTIVPTPAGSELSVGVASYGSGHFNLNTHPDYSLQKWNVSTLLLHEAAPGHHFQNAYSNEYPAKDIPGYISNVWYTAYSEGWALYTEWLGLEMSIYGELDENGKPTFVNATGMCKDELDYTNFQGGIYLDAKECNALQYFGSLNEAQLRNMRLAVDTGIHAKGWSIQEARDYMHANSAMGVGDIESESFRYAAYVGQAVSYKSGYLVIRELLAKAQTQLGDKFSWIAFHDQLLKYGAQPMEVMESSVDNWLKTQ
ncbi:hypothetical protein PCNPT3_12770 [Psychromonas sp. CNPT3]|uniref:DUF885 domain-containing protein n=1 Tax=Psychromonas sp. CNPT3 TaxID=314282 RepID=UPI00006E5090|nr:DUF885 domain-containing protein [Psychromonas sp. CNPT3]AGH82490.1 hypothetical protein PCNPT3_12770 [Psychromonas sp. CNPT3]